MGELNNKVVLITGATEGIGKQTAIELARLGASVIVHGRNDEKASMAMQEIINKSGNSKVEFCSADLSSMEEIRQMAEDISERFELIDVLINNAGVFMNERKLSTDGIELTFAVNHLAYFLLTGLLLDHILKSDYSRIVNVASQAHAHNLDFDNLQGQKHFDGYDAYSRSKLCNIVFTHKLASILAATNVTVNALHPGVIRTKLLQAGFGAGGADTRLGAETSVYLATSAEVGHLTGEYYVNRKRAYHAQIAHNENAQNKLWEVSEELTGLSYSL